MKYSYSTTVTIHHKSIEFLLKVNLKSVSLRLKIKLSHPKNTILIENRNT